MCRSSTLLPVPLRPSTTVASPRGMASDTSSSTRKAPNAFETRSIRMAAAPASSAAITRSPGT